MPVPFGENCPPTVRFARGSKPGLTHSMLPTREQRPLRPVGGVCGRVATPAGESNPHGTAGIFQDCPAADQRRWPLSRVGGSCSAAHCSRAAGRRSKYRSGNKQPPRWLGAHARHHADSQCNAPMQAKFESRIKVRLSNYYGTDRIKLACGFPVLRASQRILRPASEGLMLVFQGPSVAGACGNILLSLPQNFLPDHPARPSIHD